MKLLEEVAMHSARSVISGGKSLWRELSSDDVGDFAAGLSYRFFLALFPFFIFVTALGGLVAQVTNAQNPSERLLDRFGETLPSDARSVIDKQLSGVLGEQEPGLLSIALLGTIWAASGAVGALMKATNRMYDVEETRPFWKRTGIALGLTVLGGLFFVGAFVLAMAGRAIANAIVEAARLGQFAEAGVTVLGYVSAIVLLLAAVAFLYWAAPNARLPFRWISPGAVLFGAGWLLATLAFSFYVSRFGSYNATYGALGGVVILLIWFYLTSYILLAGAELNAMLAQKTDPEDAEVPAAEPGRWEASNERRDDPNAAARAGAYGDGGQQRSEAASADGADVRPRREREAGVGTARGLAGVAVAGVALWRAVASRRERETQSAAVRGPKSG